jgi:cytidylate kinase
MEERITRRVNQLRETGAEIEIASVKEDIQARDLIDTTRAVSPLICPDGAIQIDTSDKTIEEVTDLMEDAVRSFLSA